VGDARGALGPGELILINPDTPHYCNPSGAVDRNYYVLYLDKGWCALVQKALWGTEGFAPVGACAVRDRGLYDRFVDAMELLLREGEALEKDQAVHELVEGLFAAIGGPPAPPEGDLLDIEPLKALLAADLDRNLSLSELAASCGANPFTLLRRFKAAAGITPHAYRMNRRIERAKELLRGGADLAAIALDCGFYDQSHFTKSFKAVTAVTPREYLVNLIQ
jgi:AraC-like DNA-binding protein